MRWSRGEDVDSFGAELQAYYAAVTARLRTQAGFDDYVRLAEARRDRVRLMPIFESPAAVRPHQRPVESPRDARRRNRRGGLSRARPAEIRHARPAARARRRRPRGLARADRRRRRAAGGRVPASSSTRPRPTPAPDVMAPAISWIAFPATLLEGGHLAGAAVGGRGRLPHRAGRVLRMGASSGTTTASSPGSPSPRRCPSTSSTSPHGTSDRLLATYRDLVGPHVELDDLLDGGVYRPDNVHNGPRRAGRRT